MTFVATCLFGLEGLLGGEIDALGYERIETIDGRVTFKGPPEAAAVCNINLRYAERVLVLVGCFEARTFDGLFEGTKALPWADYIGLKDQFPVKGHSVRSALFSIPDCQSIIKKAVVKSLSPRYGVSYFEESGVKKQIEFFILKDKVSLMIDTSGAGLHKRGYRELSGVAPLRETLAAAMVNISRPRDNVIICDPMCGSGTIAIEAALLLTGRAPGLNRGFAGEEFDFLPKDSWENAREEAMVNIHAPETKIFASDIDEGVLAVARENAVKAGVAGAIEFYRSDVTAFESPLEGARGTVITNPPYGERMGDVDSARRLASAYGKAFSSSVPNWQIYIISSDPDFERYFGRKSDKKRVLYNGMIKCSLYQFFKNRR
ncbi:MAG: class I SAM-dependent RNA methyltransferase [Clostridia bacterium]|nr:class I SAM-dependent RNA methyltransferase [Clostridia bacterium]